MHDLNIGCFIGYTNTNMIIMQHFTVTFFCDPFELTKDGVQPYLRNELSPFMYYPDSRELTLFIRASTCFVF
jgi:hypothetical protein